MESVAHLLRGLREAPVRGSEVLNQVEGALATPVHHVVEDRAVTAGHVDRLENAKIGRIFHPALGVTRGLVQIHDHRVVRIGGIELGKQPAAYPLVGPCIAELAALEGDRYFVDLDPRHSGGRFGRRECGGSRSSFRGCRNRRIRRLFRLTPGNECTSREQAEPHPHLPTDRSFGLPGFESLGHCLVLLAMTAHAIVVIG